jgi:hypothetical protein
MQSGSTMFENIVKLATVKFKNITRLLSGVLKIDRITCKVDGNSPRVTFVRLDKTDRNCFKIDGKLPSHDFCHARRKPTETELQNRRKPPHLTFVG